VGNSIIEIIFGVVNPGGKLPVTFAKKYEYTPAFENFPGSIEKLKVNYEEGIYIGYRHYNK
jgi:beta-glucosidase